MKFFVKVFPLLLLLLNFIFAQGDSLPHTLLWKIEGNGLASPSFVYGTMHTADERAFRLMDSVLYAFNFCKEYAMEINPDSLNIKALAKEAMMPDGVSLKDLLSEKDFKLVKKICWKRLHLPF